MEIFEVLVEAGIGDYPDDNRQWKLGFFDSFEKAKNALQRQLESKDGFDIEAEEEFEISENANTMLAYRKIEEGQFWESISITPYELL